MTFQNVLTCLEYTVIERSDTFLILKVNRGTYLFHNNPNLQCFSITKFKHIGILEFYGDHFAHTKQNIISINKTPIAISLDFKPSDLSSTLGTALKIIRLEDVKVEELIYEESKEFLDLAKVVIPTTTWKYSREDKYYYFIPSIKTCIKFNSNDYYHYGQNIVLQQGTEKNWYLNPITMMERLGFGLPKDEQIAIGETLKGRLIIRSVIQELLTAVKLSVTALKGSVTFGENITINLLNSYSSIYPILYDSLLDQYQLDMKDFQSNTELRVDPDNKIIMKPGLTLYKGEKTTVIIFPGTVTFLQLILEELLNKLSNNPLHVENINYIPASVGPENPLLLESVQNSGLYFDAI